MLQTAVAVLTSDGYDKPPSGALWMCLSPRIREDLISNPSTERHPRRNQLRGGASKAKRLLLKTAAGSELSSIPENISSAPDASDSGADLANTGNDGAEPSSGG